MRLPPPRPLWYAVIAPEESEYEHPINAAVSGELIPVRDRREERRKLIEAEILRREALLDDQWIRPEANHFSRWFASYLAAKDAAE